MLKDPIWILLVDSVLLDQLKIRNTWRCVRGLGLRGGGLHLDSLWGKKEFWRRSSVRLATVTGDSSSGG